MARPRTPLLSRERIITAALRLVDAEGLDALSTRRLATELSVSGPSLYNHFGTKDELLDAVVDSVMGEVDLSMFTPGAPWPEALRAWARSYRAALAAHPNVVPVLAQGPGRRPNALRLADAVFGCLVESGWPRGQATRIGALMRYFVTGSALASFAAGFPEDAGLYDAADYPHLGEAHRLAEHRGAIDEGAFETGLEALLDGLALRFERTAEGARRAGGDR
ncbi:TetR/AcrR family transcriptional regulator C-terminal domain-containing protein [Kitasatospora sp. CM 4170]|uniref:TetR/AcrR family transcriptional regulator n=1 Tax=Kitasatospora aburaviensis TaxID=67265 RepID=A0ABW1EPJ3_9ACTN|nr:TetR/AcrR family transcriptional regulator C-terminal domain-containing protein [Kitasatospora sp. CM 4170]WNM48704.1 TetR/AcrR family transcriptional regulator C-terminal domain-containing protein [Kitasatospora sp. CM 4170]